MNATSSSTGIERIAGAFARAGAENRAALVGYLMAGDPDFETSRAAFRALAGLADVIEVGVPFSDPIADGATIQAAGERARKAGMTLRGALALTRELARSGDFPPVVLMTYANPVRAFRGDFAAALAEAGAAGLIVPDLPPEEEDGLGEALERLGLARVLLAAPTTPPERLEYLARKTRGFLYYVSLEGVTGREGDFAERLPERLDALRARAAVPPIAVGFGVARPEDAARLAPHADGVVVGSAFVRALASGGPEAVREAAREMREAVVR